MAVEVFTSEEFEAALPVHRETGKKLWERVGLVQGEETYRVIVTRDIFIEVRSSIGLNGRSADTGKDSIRAWLVDAEGQPLGSKVNSWTQRTSGWQGRLIDILRELWRQARKAGYCPKCKIPNGVYQVKKKNKNRGRFFKKCRQCGGGGWEWLT